MLRRDPQLTPEQQRSNWIIILLAGCGGLVALVVFGGAILGAILFPVFSQAREKARTAACLSNAKQMGLALVMYTQDYDGRLPVRTNWMDTLQPYLKNEAVYQCPSVGPPAANSSSYAYNSNLSGKLIAKIPSPATTRAIFESSTQTRNASNPVTSLPNPPRHNGGDVIGYVDGHAKWVLRGGTTPGN